MNSKFNRRAFLKRSALAAGAVSVGGMLAGCASPSPRRSGDRLNCVQIGCGSRSLTHLEWLLTQSQDHLLAIVDPDEKRHAAIRQWLQDHGQDGSKLQVFTDYRVLFDRLGKQIDAVFIAAPNHHHAPASLLAMEAGKAVFCEKPLCHDIAEARRLRQRALQAKVPTQMGNQGHCFDGYRRLCEFIWAGAIGPVTETHSWTDRSNGGIGPRPASLPTPAGLHWDEWIGPAPYRAYHAELHPHEWHGWHDFGNGSLGNMGCHVLDGVYWALKLEHPTAIEMEECRGGASERYPTGSRVRWDFPARAGMPAVKVYWYEGLKQGAEDLVEGGLRSVRGDARNLPPLLLELQKEYPDDEFDANGTLYVGTKGILYTDTYGSRLRTVPMEKMAEMPQIPRLLPRPQNVIADFLEACRANRTATAAGFDYAAQLTELTLLGNLAQRAGSGRKIEWDGPGMRVTNLPELNQWVAPACRKGWAA